MTDRQLGETFFGRGAEEAAHHRAQEEQSRHPFSDITVEGDDSTGWSVHIEGDEDEEDEEW